MPQATRSMTHPQRPRLLRDVLSTERLALAHRVWILSVSTIIFCLLILRLEPYSLSSQVTSWIIVTTHAWTALLVDRLPV